VLHGPVKQEKDKVLNKKEAGKEAEFDGSILARVLDHHNRVPRWVEMNPAGEMFSLHQLGHWFNIMLDGGSPPLSRLERRLAGVPPSFKELEDKPVAVSTSISFGLKGSPPSGYYCLDMLCLEVGNAINGESVVINQRSEYLRPGEAMIGAVTAGGWVVPLTITGPVNLIGEPLPGRKHGTYTVYLDATEALELLESGENDQCFAPYHIVVDFFRINNPGGKNFATVCVRRPCYYEKQQLGIYGSDPRDWRGDHI